MEIIINKNKGIYITKIYETYTSSKTKKNVEVIESNNKFIHSIKVAYYIMKNYKWLESSKPIDKNK